MSKYQKWYDSITLRGQSRVIEGYTERHHIIPRCLGGSDDAANLTVLTAREHYLCHLLLTKFTTGQDRRKMLYALGAFAQTAPNQHRSFSSRQYQNIRLAISKARVGVKRSADTNAKVSEARKGVIPWNKGMTGSHNHTDESKEAIRRAVTGKVRSIETRIKMSEAKKGHKSGMTGKKHSAETLAKRSATMALKREQRLKTQ